jgi:hypothetical protein
VEGMDHHEYGAVCARFIKHLADKGRCGLGQGAEGGVQAALACMRITPRQPCRAVGRANRAAPTAPLLIAPREPGRWWLLHACMRNVPHEPLRCSSRRANRAVALACMRAALQEPWRRFPLLAKLPPGSNPINLKGLTSVQQVSRLVGVDHWRFSRRASLGVLRMHSRATAWFVRRGSRGMLAVQRRGSCGAACAGRGYFGAFSSLSALQLGPLPRC